MYNQDIDGIWVGGGIFFGFLFLCVLYFFLNGIIDFYLNVGNVLDCFFKFFLGGLL